MPRETKTIWLFLCLNVALSTPFYYLVRSRGSYVTYVQGLMWCPGVAALVAAKMTRRNLREFGWEWGKSRYQLQSYFIPILYSFAAYLLVWLTGLGGFYDHAFVQQIAKKYGWGTLPGPVVISVYVLLFGTIGMLNYVNTALGEEIGWRGLLVPELSRLTTFRKTALISGILWAVWHFPILISSPFDLRLVYELLCFTIMVVGMSFAMNWLRMRSGSLWTAVFFHASHNLFIQRILTPLTVDKGRTEWFVDETGVGLALAGIVMAAIFWNSDPMRSCQREGSVGVSEHEG